MFSTNQLMKLENIATFVDFSFNKEVFVHRMSVQFSITLCKIIMKKRMFICFKKKDLLRLKFCVIGKEFPWSSNYL